MDNNLFYVAIDGISIAMTVLLVIRVFQIVPNSKMSWYVLMIGLGAISYVLSSRQDYGVLIDVPFRADFGEWFPLLNLLRNASSAWFMLICHTIFRDGEPTPKPLIALIALQLFLEEPLGWIIGGEWGPSYLTTFVHEVVPALIQISYLGFGIYWTLSQRDADLVEVRRKARVFFIAIYISQVLLSLLVERVAMAYVWIPYEYHYPIHVLFVCFGALLSTYAVFALMAPTGILTLFQPATLRAVEPAADDDFDESDHDAVRIVQALEVDLIYRQPGLSVADLAVHLGLPEYRLRSLIHNHLGYRNFNALLHHYRVAEVATALADEDQQQTPVLTLALSAGYQSINPFNRAFRDIKGMTPTDFRRQAKKHHLNSLNKAPITESDQPVE